MRQVPAPELDSYLSWFRTLPIWLDLDGLRVVHACWDENMTGQVSGPITDEFLHSACRKGQPASSSRTECWNWESGFRQYLGLPKAPRGVDNTR